MQKKTKKKTTSLTQKETMKNRGETQKRNEHQQDPAAVAAAPTSGKDYMCMLESGCGWIRTKRPKKEKTNIKEKQQIFLGRMNCQPGHAKKNEMVPSD